MGRQLRIIIPDMCYHVTARGNERKNIFKDDRDREKLAYIIGDARKMFGFGILAYVFMSNHYHFLLDVRNSNLSRVMHYVNSRYARYYNHRHRRNGHLFQSRFKAILVEHGINIKMVSAYIHLNPVRAGMVKTLAEYQWSSHLQYTGHEKGGLAEPAYVLKYFADDRCEAIKGYEKLLSEFDLYRQKEYRIKIYGDYILGNEGFVKEIKNSFKNKKLSEEIDKRTVLKKFVDPEKIINCVLKEYEIDRKTLFENKSRWNKGKNVLVYLLKRDAGLKNTEIAQLLGDYHPSGIGKIFKAMSRPERKKEIESVERTYSHQI